MGIAHPSLGEKVALLEVGTAKLIGPIDCDPHEVARVSDWLNENLKLTSEILDCLTSFEYHTPFLITCFRDIAGICKNVSEEFHVAIMGLHGTKLLSNAISSTVTPVTLKR